MVISLSEAGRLEWCNNYNKDLCGVAKDCSTAFSLIQKTLIWKVFICWVKMAFLVNSLKS